MKILSKEEAKEKLNQGFPILFQTDTLPAIGCLPKFSEIIYKSKQRNRNKALILMASDLRQVLMYVHQIAVKDVIKIANQYWPGPLTLVVPIAENENFDFISQDNTLGIRIPCSAHARDLLNAVGPLATSSANISGSTTSFNADDVSKDLPNIDILGPVPWGTCSGKASTIIAWISKGQWKLIREGELMIGDIN
tara:strand:- start:1576 stop:2157 length:582 start_codon:yes stop_codon:yes gene_type:complete